MAGGEGRVGVDGGICACVRVGVGASVWVGACGWGKGLKEGAGGCGGTAVHYRTPQCLQLCGLRSQPHSADIKSRDDVMKMGIGAYNEECRSIVMRCGQQGQQCARACVWRVCVCVCVCVWRNGGRLGQGVGVSGDGCGGGAGDGCSGGGTVTRVGAVRGPVAGLCGGDCARFCDWQARVKTRTCGLGRQEGPSEAPWGWHGLGMGRAMHIPSLAEAWTTAVADPARPGHAHITRRLTRALTPLYLATTSLRKLRACNPTHTHIHTHVCSELPGTRRSGRRP